MSVKNGAKNGAKTHQIDKRLRYYGVEAFDVDM
jgi:hypothetical protein